MVEVRGVSYAAGGVPILDAIDARFRPGTFTVILGPNGAGKSTLLKIATGLLSPTAGAVRYGDRTLDAFSSDALARTRAVLSQHVELAFPLAVEDVVLMGRYPHYGRAPSARDREIVTRALEMVGMTDRRAQPYPTLSGGERQKVHLARVLAQIWNFDDALDGARDGAPRRPESDGRGPRYLFLDEPTTSLDVHYQIHLLDIARRLVAHDCAVIAILHDLNVAFQYGDEFIVLERGRVAARVERADELSRELIERVFQVRAHRVMDPEDGRTFWRFAL